MAFPLPRLKLGNFLPYNTKKKLSFLLKTSFANKDPRQEEEEEVFPCG